MFKIDPQTWLMIYALIADVVTGFSAAFVNKEVSSNIGRKGLINHLIIALLVISLNVVANAKLAGNLNDAVSTIYTLFATGFTLTYALSILENLIKMGVNVPPKLANYLKLLDEKEDEK